MLGKIVEELAKWTAVMVGYNGLLGKLFKKLFGGDK